MLTRSQRQRTKESMGEAAQNLTSNASQARDNSNVGVTEADYSKLSTSKILKAILERNKDPVVEKMVLALASKIPQEIAEEIQSDKRARSIVISGVPEASENVVPSVRQTDLESKVSEILDILNVECKPLEIYRLGKERPSLPRLVKVVLPAKFHWSAALANSYKLRNSAYPNVYVRKSMTRLERQKDYEMRQECRERNNKLNTRAWFVYRGELRRTEDLPEKKSQGNF